MNGGGGGGGGGGCVHIDDTKWPNEQYGGMLCFFCCFIKSEDRSLMSNSIGFAPELKCILWINQVILFRVKRLLPFHEANAADQIKLDTIK